MQLLVYISNYIVPFLILSIIVYGLSAKVNVYETFIKGAKSGFFTVFHRQGLDRGGGNRYNNLCDSLQRLLITPAWWRMGGK